MNVSEKFVVVDTVALPEWTKNQIGFQLLQINPVFIFINVFQILITFTCTTYVKSSLGFTTT